MNKLVVYGQIINGKPKISNREKMDTYLESLPEGAQFELIVSPIKDFRSLKLNRTYWMYLTMIGDELGYTKHEMHDYFKAKFLCEITQVNGEDILTCKSTSDLSTREFCEYLESIFYLCAENFSIVLPDIQEIKQIKYQDRKKPS